MRVTRNGNVALDLHAGEQRVEVGGDDLLERHEALAVGHDHEAGQQQRHLDPGEAARLGDRVAHDHRQVERQVGDVGERVARVDGERGEHREDALLEHLVEVLAVVVVELVPAREDDADLAQRRARSASGKMARARRVEPVDLVADVEQLLGRRCGRRAWWSVIAGRDLVLQAGDADLEELVEVLAEDGEELGPLEQRHVGVLGQGQDAGVEVEPGELTVEVPRRVHGPETSGRPVGRSGASGPDSAWLGRCEQLSRTASVVLGDAEVPLEHEVLALGVAHDPLAVAAELRIVGRQQQQPGHDPGPEVVDHLVVAEVGPHLPVGGDRPEVHDLHVAAGRLLLGGGIGQGHGTRSRTAGSGGRRVGQPVTGRPGRTDPRG